MSTVEIADHVSCDHFLGESIALDSIGTQLAKLCPACKEGAAQTKNQGPVAAPFVAVLVSSSEVRIDPKFSTFPFLPFPLVSYHAADFLVHIRVTDLSKTGNS